MDASLKKRKGDLVQAELDAAMKRLGQLILGILPTCEPENWLEARLEDVSLVNREVAPGSTPHVMNASYVPSEVLVKMAAGADPGLVAGLAAKHGCRIAESVQTIQLYRLEIDDPRGVWEVARELEAEPAIEYA